MFTKSKLTVFRNYKFSTLIQHNAHRSFKANDTASVDISTGLPLLENGAR